MSPVLALALTLVACTADEDTGGPAGPVDCDNLSLSAYWDDKEVALETRAFRQVAVTSVRNATSCNTDASDGAVALGFVALDGDKRFIAPGAAAACSSEAALITDTSGAPAVIAIADLTPGQRGELDDIVACLCEDPSIAFPSSAAEVGVELEGARLAPVPEQPCDDNDACASPLTCQSINPGDATARTACALSTELSVTGSTQLVSATDNVGSLVILMANGETLAGVDEDGNFDPSCSPDPRDQRIAAARLLATTLMRSETTTEDWSVCVAATGADGSAPIAFFPDAEGCLTEADEDTNRLAALSIGESGRRPLWAALDAAVGQLADAPGQRAIIVFTDGPDDGSSAAAMEDTFGALSGGDIRVHVIQLDAAAGGQTCAATTTGPIDALARLACESGGSYHYATSANDLRPLFDGLANTLGAQYQVEVAVPPLRDDLLAPGAYRLAASACATLGEARQCLSLGGELTDPATLQVVDLRPVLFSRPVPE